MRCAIMWTLPVTPSGLQVVWVCHCGGRRGGKAKESPHTYTVAWFGLRARAGTVEEPPPTSPSSPLPELLLLLLLHGALLPQDARGIHGYLGYFLFLGSAMSVGV